MQFAAVEPLLNGAPASGSGRIPGIPGESGDRRGNPGTGESGDRRDVPQFATT
jgi:hypothetical protein